MANDYFAWVSKGDHDLFVPNDVLEKAKMAPPGTVRILYPGICQEAYQNAFVNGEESWVWTKCVGCYAVEEQCPEHGTAHV